MAFFACCWLLGRKTSTGKVSRKVAVCFTVIKVTYYSIVLQGVADANNKFISVDVGAYGKQSDGGTFLASDLYDILDNYKNALPLPTKIKDTEIDMPYVVLADDAYPLKL